MTLFARILFPEIVPIRDHSADTAEPNQLPIAQTSSRRRGSCRQIIRTRGRSLLAGAPFLAAVMFAASATAQPVPSGPPAVGVIKVQRRPMTDTYEFNGRIQAINSVSLVARVTAFL